jgi:putative ABC transport system ATP-binding protein
MTAILEARDLVKRYPVGDTQVDALRGVSLTVESGEFLAIMGASGSGKSTLLHMLGGLDRPTSGEIVIDGVDISRLDDEHATLTRREKTGFVFQFFNLIPLLTVRENVALPFLIDGEPLGEHAGRVDELLELVGLTLKAEHRPNQLSAGEQQRVAVARALVTRPEVVFADEPTGALDLSSGQDVLRLLRDVVDSTGQTLIMVTHDPGAAAYADRVLFLADGTLVDAMENPTPQRVADRMARMGA